MAQIFDDNSFSIGKTPLVRLNRILGGDSPVTLLGKVEGRNPAYSVKCRIGASMIWDAEERGILKPGMELIEPTSGNTGIALAYVAAARGYRLTLTMPENFSVERRRVLRILGANLELTKAEDGMEGAIQRAKELVASDGDHFVMLHQFENPANPSIHFRTTGPEIWDDTGGKVDVLIAGVGTGGTISGISWFIKKKQNHPLITVAVEPARSAVISQQLAGKELRPEHHHQIQGIGAGFVPNTLDLKMIDRVEQIEDEEAIDYARRLAREEGLLCGISCGAATAAACRLAKQPEFSNKTFVVILPDAGERYLSSALFDGMG